MDLVLLSDTHNKQADIFIPEGDAIIHAGDATVHGGMLELTAFADWFASLPHKEKIFVAGNHDIMLEKDPQVGKKLLEDRGIHYLKDTGVFLTEGERELLVYGAPWQPEFGNWAFNLPRGEQLRKKWGLIPFETEVLITHGPPLGIMDKTFYKGAGGESVGCEELLARVATLEGQKIPKLKVHVFGHIHEGYGLEIDECGVIFVNASVCNEFYKPVNPVQVLTI